MFKLISQPLQGAAAGWLLLMQQFWIDVGKIVVHDNFLSNTCSSKSSST
jgi:hypothetical protein